MLCLSTFIQLKSEDCDATGFILYTILMPEPHSLLLYTYIKKKSKQQKNSRLVKIPKLFSLKKKKQNKNRATEFLLKQQSLTVWRLKFK